MAIAQTPPPLPVGKPRSFTPLSASLASLASSLHGYAFLAMPAPCGAMTSEHTLLSFEGLPSIHDA